MKKTAEGKKIDIFISYSNKDSNIVHQYIKYIENHGYTVWYDVKGLYTGVQYTSEIAMAIENAELILFFSSEDSNVSDWTIREVTLAANSNKKILPIKLNNSPYSNSLKLILTPLQYIYVGDEFSEDKAQEIVSAIMHINGQIDQKEITSKQSPYHDKIFNKEVIKAIRIISPIIKDWVYSEFKDVYKAKLIYKHITPGIYEKLEIIEEEIVNERIKREEILTRELAGDEAQLKVAYKKFSMLYSKTNFDIADKIDANEFSRITENLKEKYKILLSKLSFENSCSFIDEKELIHKIEMSSHFEYLSMELLSSFASCISYIVMRKIAMNTNNDEDVKLYDRLINSNNWIIFEKLFQEIKGKVFSIINRIENGAINYSNEIDSLKREQNKSFNQLQQSYNNMVELVSSKCNLSNVLLMQQGEYIPQSIDE